MFSLLEEMLCFKNMILKKETLEYLMSGFEEILRGGTNDEKIKKILIIIKNMIDNDNVRVDIKMEIWSQIIKNIMLLSKHRIKNDNNKSK